MKGFAPCRRPLNSGFDDMTLRCFDGLRTADHLPLGLPGGECLVDGLLTTWTPLEARGHAFWRPFWLLGPDVGDLGRDPGHGLGPGLARGPHNGLDCTPAGAGAWFYQEPGIQNLFQGGGDLLIWGPTINLTTA